MISILHYLYRNSRLWAIAVLAAALLWCGQAEAQIRDRTHQQPEVDKNESKINAKTPKRGPRAIAVLEFLPGNGTRLVPVALWIDGHYKDASLYAANPEPMALEPETLYEVLNTGESAGWFTVTSPHEDKGTWVADGQWKPRRVLDEQIAERAAKEPKKKAPSLKGDDEGPPVLRRPGSEGSPASASSGSSGSGGSSPAGGSHSASGGNVPPPGDDDPDRPTLKAPKQASAPANPSTASSDTQQAGGANASGNVPSTEAGDEGDPNRPVLRRGKPAGDTANAKVTLPPVSASLPGSNGKSRASSNTATIVAHRDTGQVPHSLAAISDAGTIEARPLLYTMSESERQNQLHQMSALAVEELRKFSAQHNLPAPAKTATLADTDFRAFDLDFSNSPTLVLSGKLPFVNPKLHGAASNYFVTVVAREDINGVPQKIFASVTTNSYLDAFPHMEIVDALDADANGRGDLLFRQYSDTGISYALYRVYPYQMVKIFEGGASM